GALQITSHPVQVLGGAAQHGPGCSSVPGAGARTQVSLVPPPWLELTTSDPSLRPTRVRPPGMMVILRPDSTKGRRSTWRGATPWPTKVGRAGEHTPGLQSHSDLVSR